MAERETRRVALDLLYGPLIAGRHISVRPGYAPVEGRGVDPETA